MNDIERLKQTLIENGESPEEADSLAQVGHFLRKLPTPEANKLHQAQTLKLISAHLPRQKSRWEKFKEWYPVAILFSQIRVIHGEIWLASALILLTGLIVTLSTSNLVVFSALAPIVTALGIALLYDHNVQMMLEIEETTRASARVLLLARLTLVFSFNLILAVIGSVVMAVLNTEVSLVPMILSWLAPMTFLSGLAFLSSVLLVDTFAASAFSLLLWLVHLILKSQTLSNGFLKLLALPGLSDISNRPLLMLTGLLLVVVGLWIVGLPRGQHENH